MISRLSRRSFLMGSLAIPALAHHAWAQDEPFVEFAPEEPFVQFDDRSLDPGTDGTPLVTEEQYFDPALLPPPESEIDFPIEPVNPRKIKKQFRRQMVDFEGYEDPGTLVVDPDNRYLYHVLAYGRAKRYGVGVGRAGFAWAGDAKIGMKRRWPRWVPPREMVDRDENARKWVNGQPGGPDNPLGARALYL